VCADDAGLRHRRRGGGTPAAPAAAARPRAPASPPQAAQVRPRRRVPHAQPARSVDESRAAQARRPPRVHVGPPPPPSHGCCSTNPSPSSTPSGSPTSGCKNLLESPMFTAYLVVTLLTIA